MAPRVYCVTGANKGIGYEVVRILAEHFKDQAIVLLGTRSIERGNAALAKMKQDNPSFEYANVHLLEMDVSEPTSIQPAAAFVEKTYGHVHVLVNNAGVFGREVGSEMCFQVNVFGVLDVLEAFRPLLVPNQSSNIVVASSAGAWTLRALSEQLQAIFEDFNALDVASVRSLLDDWKIAFAGKPSQFSWPAFASTNGAYGISKMALMALIRKWAVDHPDIKTTMVCPGYCITDISYHTGFLTAAQGGEHVLFPVFHEEETISGRFYRESKETSFKAPRPEEYGPPVEFY
ncbi:hypothetical protein LEN26_009713 [Aphanomyces euteiches]|nr:hypothetical protein AeMF1_013736 [Aphanomyces euteiches]KAH9124452.1 hypothetical protein LEN26_009713 [Aphanomyces euteiches]